MNSESKHLSDNLNGENSDIQLRISELNEEEPEHDTDISILQDEDSVTNVVHDIHISPSAPPCFSTKTEGPRCIIKRIENVNFKSFAGKIISRPFHHNVTAILGLNYGKSNVMDSVLFLFGYQANKLRSLVHNLAFIQIWTVSDSEDGSCQELSNSRFIVKHTVFKNGSSFYAINGQKVQFKKVNLLLKKHGIDLNAGRFIILQGELQSIGLMKPKGLKKNENGMLEYLENVKALTIA
uniref:SMC_N domain-containing protein n=1 Tax=Glossina brevipalpis TaxID=37001 RepID=A0A1A9WLW7_9MUSC